jgi:hypothetical protein
MNCRIASLVLACMLTGCQTPPAARDLGTLTAKFAAQMDGSITTYVTALNSNNASDAPRIHDELANAARLRAEDTDDAALWHLDSGARAASVNRLLALISSLSPTDSNPVLTGATQTTPSLAPPSITFDDAPLKTIETVAGGIAKPLSLYAQLSVIAVYAKTVQGDLKSSTSNVAPKK